MPSHGRSNGSGSKRKGKAEKHRAKYLQVLNKRPKQLRAVYEPTVSVLQPSSSEVANEEMHSSTDLPVQINANSEKSIAEESLVMLR